MPDEIQNVTEGFGGYLDGVVPPSQARVAGALAATFQQVKNISKVQPDLLGQAVYNLESTDGLPLTEGAGLPVNTELVQEAQDKAALGTGLYGTYTMSDFFGSVSGLPYAFDELIATIGTLMNTPAGRTLKGIYAEMKAIANWAPATGVITFRYDFITGEHTPTGFALGYAGAGYTSPPAVFGSNGSEGYGEIGTNPDDLETFGRVTKLVMTVPGDPWLYPDFVTVTIDPPAGTDPDANVELLALAGGANSTIASIKNSNPAAAEILTVLHDLMGTTLKAEQQARYTAVPPVSIPRNPVASSYPADILSAVESMSQFAEDTMPHGAASILENMCDFCSPGGQSMIATMRQTRNTQRLAEVGIGLDNEVPDTIPKEVQKLLMANGTAPGARRGVVSPSGAIYTPPAYPGTKDCDGTTLVPEPSVYYDPNIPGLRDAESLRPGTISDILRITDPEQVFPGPGPGPGTPGGGGTRPPVIVGPQVPGTGGPPTSGPGTGYPPGGGGNNPPGTFPPGGPGTGTPGGGGPGTGPPGGGGGGTFPPGGGGGGGGGPGTGFPPGTGRPIITNPPIIPPTGNIRLIGGSLISSRLNPEDARQRVIDCNCDCWLD